MKASMLASLIIYVLLGVYNFFIDPSLDFSIENELPEDWLTILIFAAVITPGIVYYKISICAGYLLDFSRDSGEKMCEWIITIIQMALFNSSWFLLAYDIFYYFLCITTIYASYVFWTWRFSHRLNQYASAPKMVTEQMKRRDIVKGLKHIDFWGLISSVAYLAYLTWCDYKLSLSKDDIGSIMFLCFLGGTQFLFLIYTIHVFRFKGFFTPLDPNGDIIYK